ncbi:hypothetical protein F4775DRAFT_148095 [Biscogniauxia sp. FL1348]|nr:hypothetical protein F4775DRAFT_148095 [Biscogniauxia sp. FL1348]
MENQEPGIERHFHGYIVHAMASAVFMIHSIPVLQGLLSRVDVTMHPKQPKGMNCHLIAALRLCSELREALRHGQEGWYHLWAVQIDRLIDAAYGWQKMIRPVEELFHENDTFRPDLTWLLNTIDRVSVRQATPEEPSVPTPLSGQHFNKWKAERSGLADVLGVNRLTSSPCSACETYACVSTCTLVITCQPSKEFYTRTEKAPKLSSILDRDLLRPFANKRSQTEHQCEHGVFPPQLSLLHTSQFIILRFLIKTKRTRIDFEGADIIEFPIQDLYGAERKVPYVLVAISGVNIPSGDIWDTYTRVREPGAQKWLFFNIKMMFPEVKQPWDGVIDEYDVKFLIFESLESWNSPHQPSHRQPSSS